MLRHRTCWCCLRAMLVGFAAVALAVLAIACGSVRSPTSAPADTPPPTPAPSPTSPPSPATLLPEAKPLCEGAFSSPVITGSLSGPAMYLENVRYEQNEWVHIGFPHQAQSVQEVRTLVCILQDREAVGQYTDVTTGYQIIWKVRLVSWPEGKVLGARTLEGSGPPEAKIAGSGPAYGREPATALGEWLVSTWGERSVLFVCDTGVESISFSADGETLTTGCRHGSVDLWDVSTGQLARFFGLHEGGVYNVAFSPDGKTVASAGRAGTVNLWRWEPGQGVFDEVEVRTFTEHKGGACSLAFSPDGAILATGGEEDGVVVLWDVATGQKVQTLGESEWLACASSLVFWPDGTKLASGHEHDVKLWDLVTGQEVRTFTGHTDTVWSVALSPDLKTLASGSWDGTVKLWDVATGQEVRTLSGHSDKVYGVAFAPDGQVLASGSADQTVKLWSAATGQEVRTLIGHTLGVNRVAFAPDGKTLASGSADGTVKLWDVETGR